MASDVLYAFHQYVKNMSFGFSSSSAIYYLLWLSQVLSLEWSSGMETVQCLSRIDLSLPGSFSDVVITAGTMGCEKNASLFVLTNPGQLHMFDGAGLSASLLQKEKTLSVHPVDFPPVVPTISPLITVANLFTLPTEGDSSKALAEVMHSCKHKKLLKYPLLCLSVPFILVSLTIIFSVASIR